MNFANPFDGYYTGKMYRLGKTDKLLETNCHHIGFDEIDFRCEMRDWNCRRCGQTSRGISDFVTHLDYVHANDCGIVCPECDKEFPSKKRLKVHMVLHSDKKFTCPVSVRVEFQHNFVQKAKVRVTYLNAEE